MTIPADPQPNERKFRFKDEWLVSLVATMPGVTQELIKRWRFQQKPYIAQALIDGDVLSFREIAEVVKDAFRIDYVDLTPGAIDKNAMQILPEKLCREHNVLPVKVDSRMVHLAMATRGITAEEFPCDIIGPFYYEDDIVREPLDIKPGRAQAAMRPEPSAVGRSCCVTMP